MRCQIYETDSNSLLVAKFWKRIKFMTRIIRLRVIKLMKRIITVYSWPNYFMKRIKFMKRIITAQELPNLINKL